MTATDTPTTQALAKVDSRPDSLLDRYRADFSLVLPTHINGDQWVRVAQGVLRRNRDVARIAQNNPGSFLFAMLDCARLGLEVGDTYHLVPFGKEIVGIKDYKGELELVYRAGAVRSVVAEIVYENDPFEYDTRSPEPPAHKPKWFGGDRGRMVGGYAYAHMIAGGISRVVLMDEAMFNRHKAESKTASRKDSLWNKWTESAWLKTLVHELKKWVPTSPEYRNEVLRAQTALDDISGELSERLPEPLPIEDHGTDDDVVEAEIVDDDEPRTYAPDDPERPFDEPGSFT